MFKARKKAFVARARSFRPKVERLEDRSLLNAAPNDLNDSLIKPVADGLFMQDNSHLSRSDVIHILDLVGGTEQALFSNGTLIGFISATPDPNATLSASQLTDLQTLAKDSGPWGMAPDVANLLSKLANYNPANVNFHGIVVLPSGALGAGDNDKLLRDLSSKWFYGSDLPNISAAVADFNIPGPVIYEKAQGVLFGAGGPRSDDIAQGWDADCYFLSSLGEAAHVSPQTIKNMFIDNADGTYTVRFFKYDPNHNSWSPDYVTVNLELPTFKQTSQFVQQAGEFVFADWYQNGQPVTYTDATAVLWPALAEKAYAQLAEEGWSRSIDNAPIGSGNDSTPPKQWNKNSYDALSNGNGAALEQIVGSNNCADISLTKISLKEPAQLQALQAKISAQQENQLAQAVQAGDLVIVASLPNEPASVPVNNGVPLIIQTHVYFLTSANAQTDQFTLVNPLDDSSIAAGDGARTVTLTWANLSRWLNDCFIVTPPSLVANPQAIISLESLQPTKLIFSVSQVLPGDVNTLTFDVYQLAEPSEIAVAVYLAPVSGSASAPANNRTLFYLELDSVTDFGIARLASEGPFITGASVHEFGPAIDGKEANAPHSATMRHHGFGVFLDDDDFFLS
jgi:hypothetical protein